MWIMFCTLWLGGDLVRCQLADDPVNDLDDDFLLHRLYYYSYYYYDAMVNGPVLQASETCRECYEGLHSVQTPKVATVFSTPQSDNYLLPTWCFGFQQASAWDGKS